MCLVITMPDGSKDARPPVLWRAQKEAEADLSQDRQGLEGTAAKVQQLQALDEQPAPPERCLQKSRPADPVKAGADLLIVSAPA